MSDDSESRSRPRGKELVGTVPGVETDAETAEFQKTIHFGECWSKPSGVVVVRNTTAVSVTVVDEIRRIGEDEIDR